MSPDTPESLRAAAHGYLSSGNLPSALDLLHRAAHNQMTGRSSPNE